MSLKNKQQTKQGVKQLSMDDNLFEKPEAESSHEKSFRELFENDFSVKPSTDVIESQKSDSTDNLSVDNVIENMDDAHKSFEELLEDSLHNESSQSLIKEKIKLTEKIELSKKTKLLNYPEPQDEIDLHGLRGDEAALKTDFFIRDAKSRGLVTIRIIVGKGTHSKGRAVLPDIIECKLIDLKREGQVSTFKWEKRRKLKSGAILVYLFR